MFVASGAGRHNFNNGDFLDLEDSLQFPIDAFHDPSSPEPLDEFHDPNSPESPHASGGFDVNSLTLSEKDRDAVNHLCTVMFNRTFDIDTYLANMPSVPDSASIRSDVRDYHSAPLSRKFGRYFRGGNESDYDLNSLGKPSATNFIQLFNTIKVAAKRIFYGTDAGYPEESDRLTGEKASVSGSRGKNFNLMRDADHLLVDALARAKDVLDLRIGYLASNLLSRFVFFSLAVMIMAAKFFHQSKPMKSCVIALAIMTLFMIRQHYRFTIEEETRVFKLKLAFMDYVPDLSRILSVS